MKDRIRAILREQNEEPYGEWAKAPWPTPLMKDAEIQRRQQRTISQATAEKMRGFIMKKHPEFIEVIISTLNGMVNIYPVVEKRGGYEEGKVLRQSVAALGKYFNAGHQDRIGFFPTEATDKMVDDYGEIFLAGDWRKYSRVLANIEDEIKKGRSK